MHNVVSRAMQHLVPGRPLLTTFKVALLALEDRLPAAADVEGALYVATTTSDFLNNTGRL